MIVSYRDKRTERFSAGSYEKAFEDVDRTARIRLNRMNAAHSLADLAMMPGNRFEKLKADRAGQFSIRINDKWRICFTWDESARGFANVEIVDYH